METLFGKLSHDFDFILVDSPPVVPVIDAVLINKLTHGLIMVVAADRTQQARPGERRAVARDRRRAGRRLRPQHGAAPRSTAHRYGYYGHNREVGTKLTRS